MSAEAAAAVMRKEGEMAARSGKYPVHCPHPSGTREYAIWLDGWLHEKSKALTAHWKFKAVMLADDERTGYKKGKVLHPKGFYYNGKKIILVGCVKADHGVRLALPANIVYMEVWR